MNSKKVWFVILIMFGVLFFVGGAHGFYEASFHSQDTRFVEIIAEKYSGKAGMNVCFAAQFGEIILRIKTKFAIFTLMGITATILGAVFLHEMTAFEKENRDDDGGDTDMIEDEGTWTLCPNITDADQTHEKRPRQMPRPSFL